MPAGHSPIPVGERPGRSLDARPARRRTAIFGGGLILVGAILLAGQLIGVDLGRYGWPLFVIGPGVLILVIALTATGVVSEGLAITGSLITVTGLILLYQNATDHFESWAYAWALVFPGAIGAGMVIYGVAAGRPGNVRAGSRLVVAGVIIFLLGAAFFEGVLGIGGYQLGQKTGIALGVAIIAVGVLMLIVSLASNRRGAS